MPEILPALSPHDRLHIRGQLRSVLVEVLDEREPVGQIDSRDLKYTVDQLAEMFHKTPQCIHGWQKKGILPKPVLFQGKAYWPADEFRGWWYWFCQRFRETANPDRMKRSEHEWSAGEWEKAKPEVLKRMRKDGRL